VTRQGDKRQGDKETRRQGTETIAISPVSPSPVSLSAVPETTLTAFGVQIRNAEAIIAHLVDIASHSKFTDLTPGDKRQLEQMREIQAKVGDAGYELLLVQEIIHQILAHAGE